MIDRQFNKHIITFRFDGGGEYINNKFKTLCTHWGINHQYSCPYTPAKTVYLKENTKIFKIICSLLFKARLPPSLWVEALHPTTYLINRLPSPTLNNLNSYAKLYNKSPSYSHLKSFVCLCYPWLRPYNNSKLPPLSLPCVFIGYTSARKGYRCLHPPIGKNLCIQAHNF